MTFSKSGYAAMNGEPLLKNYAEPKPQFVPRPTDQIAQSPNGYQQTYQQNYQQAPEPVKRKSIFWLIMFFVGIAIGYYFKQIFAKGKEMLFSPKKPMPIKVDNPSVSSEPISILVNNQTETKIGSETQVQNDDGEVDYLVKHKEFRQATMETLNPIAFNKSKYATIEPVKFGELESDPKDYSLQIIMEDIKTQKEAEENLNSEE